MINKVLKKISNEMICKISNRCNKMKVIFRNKNYMTARKYINMNSQITNTQITYNKT